ncbi:Lachesin [Melipona quadrifasciata]|uniref:Lachesin n=1 Tax=Melipona quadrifasciata TaxID=166423 RepID=A0A0N0U412_9HYME|nr:Lachesin [Melipona quadrifasciata]
MEHSRAIRRCCQPFGVGGLKGRPIYTAKHPPSVNPYELHARCYSTCPGDFARSKSPLSPPPPLPPSPPSPPSPQSRSTSRLKLSFAGVKNFYSDLPRFAEEIQNVTVSKGRDALLACIVDNLRTYKVAWVRVDTQTILSIHHNVITQNPRILLSYNDHRTWYLHIKKVEEVDRGWYMCQVNTDPMRSRQGYLEVVVTHLQCIDNTVCRFITKNIVWNERPSNFENEFHHRCTSYKYTFLNLKDKIKFTKFFYRRHETATLNNLPPSIITKETSTDMVVREGSNVTLTCKASGYPEPYIMWRREDGKNINYNGDSVNVVNGEVLHIVKISRLHMGAYLCIASNDVPPRVSQRISLRVQFPPMLSIPNQLEAAYIGQDVMLECHTEAYPTSINYWTTERGDMIVSGDKYEAVSTDNGYNKYMMLKIRNVGPKDFGSYKCVAQNSLGGTDGDIKLDEIPAPSTTSTTPPPYYVTSSMKKNGRNGNKKLRQRPIDYEVEEWRDPDYDRDYGPPSMRPPGELPVDALSPGVSHRAQLVLHLLRTRPAGVRKPPANFFECPNPASHRPLCPLCSYCDRISALFLSELQNGRRWTWSRTRGGANVSLGGGGTYTRVRWLTLLILKHIEI